MILSSRTRERVYRDGQVDEGIVSLGPAGGFADAITPADDIVERLMAEASDDALAEADRDIAAAALNRLYAYATEGVR